MAGMASFDFAGKVVIVTGGTKGIGAGIAEAFARAGADVIVTGRRKEPLDEMEALVPGRITGLQMDVSSSEDRKRTIQAAVDRFGRLDVLVNNAISASIGPFEELTEEQIQGMCDVLFGATAAMTSLALPSLKATKGCVINISSTAGRFVPYPSQGTSVYGAVKAGVNHLTKNLGAELAHTGVRFNAILPGPTNSESMEKAMMDPVLKAAVAASVPMGRIGEPEDIAGVALFLASDAAGWVTGQIIDAAGGSMIA